MGKNVLVQLEQKMKGYTNGPWYVDSRDGVIYIHNRKYHEERYVLIHIKERMGKYLEYVLYSENDLKELKQYWLHVKPDSKDFCVLSTGMK